MRITLIVSLVMAFAGSCSNQKVQPWLAADYQVSLTELADCYAQLKMAERELETLEKLETLLESDFLPNFSVSNKEDARVSMGWVLVRKAIVLHEIGNTDEADEALSKAVYLLRNRYIDTPNLKRELLRAGNKLRFEGAALRGGGPASNSMTILDEIRLE